jgi:starch phosphorylase
MPEISPRPQALRSFTVRPNLPEALAPLHTLAMNLRWSWDEHTRDLFRWVGPDEWDASHHDPVRLLGLVSPARLDELAADPGFLRFLDEVHDELRGYLSRPGWFQAREADSPLRAIAYFSPEFGIAEALPQYSGGLGVLAGDHLKASSSLGLPLVGVGLFYRHGYFRQALSLDGWQQERYPDLDPYGMALTLEEGATITVELAGQPTHARIWRADVGRVPLYLLDTDVEDNPPELRGITDRLYGGDSDHRLRQEVLLGVGGVRALEALGIEAQVFHTNEGHAGFLGLERIRRLMTDQGLGFAEAVEAVRGGTVFTTHTPVPAGIDRFTREQMATFFGAWCAEVGVTLDELMAIGHRTGDLPEERFNMAVMGLRLASRSNAVAKLHGAVSREMFADLWPDVPVEEVPIGAITNGVHAATWVAPEIADVLSRHVLPEWHEAGPDRWARILDARDDDLWRAKAIGRERMVAFVRRRLRESFRRRGFSPSDLAWCDDVLDPSALTIGFARRFATYKRATLLLQQPERLQALLGNSHRPVQFVFAGKSHPADDSGKSMIQEIVRFASDLGIRHRFVYLEDYDIAVARALYQGADVWLNTPRRPMEACGTSGMKAALNGSLNCSVLDGWWDECFDGSNGWAITSAEAVEDTERRDETEAHGLFELLERQIVPLFYDRRGATPTGWLAMVKHALASLGPQVTASRQVRDYATDLYEPAAAHDALLRADGCVPAKDLAAWKARVLAAWDGVHVDAVDASAEPVEVGSASTVTATVSLGSLGVDDVEVQLVRGTVTGDEQLTDIELVAMAPAGSVDDTHLRFEGTFTNERAGRVGVTVRVVPSHPLLATSVDLGRIAWA